VRIQGVLSALLDQYGVAITLDGMHDHQSFADLGRGSSSANISVDSRWYDNLEWFRICFLAGRRPIHSAKMKQITTRLYYALKSTY